MFDMVGKFNVICYWGLNFFNIVLNNYKLELNIINLMYEINKKLDFVVINVIKFLFSF